MRRTLPLLVLGLVWGLAGVASADEIWLRNGQVVRGRIVLRSDMRGLGVADEAAGLVRVAPDVLLHDRRFRDRVTILVPSGRVVQRTRDIEEIYLDDDFGLEYYAQLEAATRAAEEAERLRREQAAAAQNGGTTGTPGEPAPPAQAWTRNVLPPDGRPATLDELKAAVAADATLTQQIAQFVEQLGYTASTGGRASHQDVAVQGLIAIGYRAIPALPAAIRDGGNPYRARNAIRVIQGLAGDAESYRYLEEVIPALIDDLTYLGSNEGIEGERFVRQAAGEALAQLAGQSFGGGPGDEDIVLPQEVQAQGRAAAWWETERRAFAELPTLVEAARAGTPPAGNP